ncbi:MAG: tripartite tricarboxylate transporter substrate binding protein [Betaproteobacteria bacterium]|nr:tripartite tricarboxylate transporter substrate binding protein [Betaproteobacteria bacterium]
MLNLRLLSMLCLSMSVPWAWAQDYPTKPVRLIVPLAPGGGVDNFARGIAASLTESLKQTVVVDNRAGAAGSLGAGLVARATPDGYTLLMASASFLIYPLINPGPYDPVRDFAPVTHAVSQPLLLAINSVVPAKTVSELIALARAKPGTLNYGSSGNGGFPHLAAELFKAMTATNLVHIPYKGASAALPDLIAGQIQFMFGGLALIMPHIKSGKLRGLALSGRTRLKNAPEFPTLHEAGVPGFDATQSYGVLAPAGTPRPVIDRLQREIAVALQRPELIAQLAIDGQEPVASSPRQFERHIRSELDKWRKVIKEAGVRGE